ncbi:MAG: hypothetical protein JXR26_03090 [Balneolaceae bacterium]|nr:hypothetical protein [Balneolaceae bacterium]
MKLLQSVFIGLTLTLLSITSPLQAQSRFQSQHLKNVDDARRKAVAGTLLPVAVGIGAATFIESKTVETTGSMLAIYGLMMGPSAGNFYAKDYLRGMLGVAARVGGGFLILDATRELAGDDVADAVGWDDESVSLTDTKILIGSGLILGSAVYNIISAKASVNRYNEKQGYVIGMVPGIRKGKVFPMITASVRF